MNQALAYKKPGHTACVRVVGKATFAVVFGWSVAAAAQTTGDKALAEQLFRTGQDLMGQNRYAEACPKLAESQRLDPGTGTLLNLAVCHEHEGKLASAWSEYNDAATYARHDQRPDRVQYAEQHASALEPKLSRLTVDLASDADVPGLQINLDGEALGRAALGVGAPVDPGSHTVSANAPGKRPWQAKIDIAQGPAQKSVQIPKLVDAPTAAASGSGASPSGAGKPQGSGNPQRMGAYALGGLGVVGVGVGAFFGLRAISKNQQSNDDGCAGNQCPPDAAVTRRSAASAGNVSTIAFIVGGVALAGGVTLYLTAPSSRRDDKSASARPSLALTAGLGSLGLSRTW